jgi:hypothetical protein
MADTGAPPEGVPGALQGELAISCPIRFCPFTWGRPDVVRLGWFAGAAGADHGSPTFLATYVV